MRAENTHVMYNPLELNSKVSKHQRVLSLHNQMKTGRILFPKYASKDGMAELLYELKGYTNEGKTTKHDDAIDCLANFNDPNFIVSSQVTMGAEGEEFADLEYSVQDSAVF